jgi:hypothetical protein
VQVEPIKPTLKAPISKRLKLKRDEPLSNAAFNFNLRCYTKAGKYALRFDRDLERDDRRTDGRPTRPTSFSRVLVSHLDDKVGRDRLTPSNPS